MGETRDIIERFDQLTHEITLSPRSSILSFLERALAIIVVLGGKPQIPVPVATDFRRLARSSGPTWRCVGAACICWRILSSSRSGRVETGLSALTIALIRCT